MKIWLDVAAPKDLLFFKLLVAKLRKKHAVLYTARRYSEINYLAKIHRLAPINVGRHGGATKLGKLNAGTARILKLADIVVKFSPDVLISHCSPEAARVAFGLGIKHLAFNDTPHATAAMKLTAPFVHKLFTPHLIPKKDFAVYGIKQKDIIHYRAIDGAVMVRNGEPIKGPLPFRKKNRKNILVRAAEEHAAYYHHSNKIIPIVKEISKEFADENVVILGRYADQIKRLKKAVGNKARVVRMSYDGLHLLQNTDVFVGSGGTMTTEAAFVGVPTISYNAVPNWCENYLVKRHIITRAASPNQICNFIKKDHPPNKRAERFLANMEDPFEKLEKFLIQE